MSELDGRLTIRGARGDEASLVADIFLGAFHTALPAIRLAHSDDEVREWIALQVETGEVLLALDGETPAAMMIVRDGWIEQLYVAPASQRRGLGAALLRRARELSPAGIRLYTFQANAAARAFYEKHGFRATEFGDGSGNQEGEPDVLYTWVP
ncbi:MAG: GNAT family N-acetyltransferase [Candidatus Dormibacteria bacterium]